MGPGRGAVAVGVLDELPPLEAGTVRAFRLWCSGPEHRAALDVAFSRAFGPGPGRARLEALGRCLALLIAGARRPIMRHQPDCACLGAHECTLAHCFAAAAEGEREEATLLACLLVRADAAPGLVGVAEGLAPCLACLAERPSRRAVTRPPPGRALH